jgi:fermentation-respiration switch protein FrsA (DUF1100 family)
MKLIRRDRLFQFLLRAAASVLVPGLLLSGYVLWEQERFIFPAVDFPKSEKPFNLPPGVRELTLSTSDGERLQAFTSISEGQFRSSSAPPFVAVILHGNGETAEILNFIPFFRMVGIPALTFDYRGFGHSSGWPSEQGLYRDAEAAAAMAQELTGLPYSQFVVLGNSIGSGPASYLASKIQPRALIIIAGYQDFADLVAEKPPYSLLSFGLRYRFPVREYVKKLTSQCVVLAHGRRDEIIPFSHLAGISGAVPSTASLHVLTSEIASHDDIYYKVEQQLVEQTRACLGL